MPFSGVYHRMVAGRLSGGADDDWVLPTPTARSIGGEAARAVKNQLDALWWRPLEGALKSLTHRVHGPTRPTPLKNNPTCSSSMRE